MALQTYFTQAHQWKEKKDQWSMLSVSDSLSVNNVWFLLVDNGIQAVNIKQVLKEYLDGFWFVRYKKARLS